MAAPKHAAPPVRDTKAKVKHRAVEPNGKAEAAKAVAGQAAKVKPTGRGGKPSVARSTVGGAAGGAATGAALGSVVPGIGTAVGAGAGAVVGGAGGALKAKAAKKEWKKEGGGGRKILVAEFAICIVILALSPLAGEEGEVTPGRWMKRGGAMCGLFFLLGLVSAVGPRAAKVAAAFGGLVTLALLIDQRSLFGVIASTLSPGDQGAAGSVGEAAGAAAADVAQSVGRYQ